MQYQDMTKKEMQREYHRLCQRYQEYEQQGLQLDLSRGKPAPEQLALSQRMLGELNSRSVLDSAAITAGWTAFPKQKPCWPV